MLYKVVLTFESVNENQSVTIQMKAIEQYFPVVLFIILYKVVLVVGKRHSGRLRQVNSVSWTMGT